MNQTDSQVDYAALYDGYWSRPDRFGEHSFADPKPIAKEILRACGNGRVLDVGCGMGLLVRSLLAQHADAHGVDVSELAVEHCNRLAPGRFHHGSILALPFEDDAFDVVVSTDCMEHLAEQDVPKALAELHRVTRGSLYLRLATTPDRDGHWHLTVKPRPWWEQQLFAAGFRKHPRAMAITPYEQLERDPWQITCVLEKLAPPVLAAHPLERLLLARDLHMDMLRESGRRADAHVARYQLAAGYVRPNDVVLDVACGLGYGAAVLAANSAAAEVLGVDLGDDAIAYASAVTGSRWPQTRFRAGDACALGFLADASIDLVTSFETLEHVPDPAALLRELARVLKPSGRILVSVPNQWVDDTGRDPNPHHLHVYDWPRLQRELAAQFTPEAVWAQTAGGGMKLGTAPRNIVRCPLAAPQSTPAEWWLAMAMRSPLGHDAAGYRETSFPTKQPPPAVVAFARDYDNPWLVKAMVSRGHRLDDQDQLQLLAASALRQAAPHSADAGASLCVLAYRLLDDPTTTAAAVDDMVARIDAYAAAAPANVTVLRWQISLLYVAARLQLWCGRRQQARELFARCSRLDVKAYSPILGTKTVDAALQNGLSAAADGDDATARQCFVRAITATERLFQGSWEPILGAAEQPIAFGLVEATDVVDVAAAAGNHLVQLPARARHPGFSHEAGSLSMRSHLAQLETALQDSRQWADRLQAALLHKDTLLAEAARASEQLTALRAQLQTMAEHNLAQAREISSLSDRLGVLGTLRMLGRRLLGRR